MPVRKIKEIIAKDPFELEQMNQNKVEEDEPNEPNDQMTLPNQMAHTPVTNPQDLVSHFREMIQQGYSNEEIYDKIAERLDIEKILKKASEDWDGGYAMAGLLGHGDAFVLRDPSGIRPVSWFENDEIVVVASERAVLQTAFNLREDEVSELKPGSALIIKKNGNVFCKSVY